MGNDPIFGLRASLAMVESTAYSQRAVDLSSLLPPTLPTEIASFSPTETGGKHPLSRDDSQEKDLRPVIIEGRTSEPFGNRPIGTREFEVLKQEDRLASVLQVTLDRVGDAYPSMTHWLAIEMCKMDGGLKGPDRTLILDLAESTIRGGRLAYMRNDHWGDMLIEALKSDERLIPLLKEIIEKSKGRPMGTMEFSAMALLIEVLEEGNALADHRKEQLISMARQLISEGGYAVIASSTLDAIGHDQVLSMLRSRPAVNNPNSQDWRNLMHELENEMMRR